MRVLFVCSGNLCRSPLGAQVLTARLGRDAPAFTVESAGTIAQDGAPMDEAAAAQSRRLGGSPDDHRARYLTPAIAGAADLVLTAERAHRAAVVSLAPRATKRAFTIVQFARVLDALEPPTSPVSRPCRNSSSGWLGSGVRCRPRSTPRTTTSTTPTVGRRRRTPGWRTRSGPPWRRSRTPCARCAERCLLPAARCLLPGPCRPRLGAAESRAERPVSRPRARTSSPTTSLVGVPLSLAAASSALYPRNRFIHGTSTPSGDVYPELSSSAPGNPGLGDGEH